MIAVELQLRYAAHPQRATCARLLEGGDTRDWLDVLCATGAPLSELALYVVPTSGDDLTPQGLLAVHPALAGDAIGQPYGAVGERVFVPVDATFTAEVTEREWGELPGGAYVAAMWHPRVGLIGFEERDRLRVSDLLAMPVPSDVDWGVADAGDVINSRLHSVTAIVPPTMQLILEQGRDGIGGKAGDLKKLPRSPREPSPILGNIGRGLVAPFAMGARWLTRRAPGGASSPTWINHLENWANRMLGDWANIWDARARELRRLMEMLDSNPDEGLKYAIPQGRNTHRGVAHPGTRLTGRNVDFSLGGLGGSGPADFWGIAPDVQAQLNERYRKLATREVGLGRYRRAAYIYAELLGDLNSAATVLAQGGHYREAAVLYRDELKRPWDAARCLEQGKLLHEAIPIYAELQEFEKVGDLHAQLEEMDEARGAWKQAVDQSILKRDLLHASKILLEKLDDPDNALAALDNGWPGSGQARMCLAEYFSLLGRLGRREAARQRLTALDNDQASRNAAYDLVEVMITVAGDFPDERVRDHAADVARVTTSRALLDHHRDRDACVRAIERLVPADKLLSRDCRRYGRVQAPPRPKRPPLTGPRSSTPPELLRRIELHPDCEWELITTSVHAFYCVGRLDMTLTIARGVWHAPDGNVTAIRWRSPRTPSHPVLLSVDTPHRSGIALRVLGWPPLPPRMIPATTHFPTALTAETPSWLSDESAVIDSLNGTARVLELPAFVLKWINRDGITVASRGLPPMDELRSAWEANDPACLHARHDETYVSLGQCLWRVREDIVETITLDAPVRSIVGTTIFSRTRIAFLFERGGTVYWPAFRGGEWCPLPDDERPHAVFLRDGRLVVCSNETWRVFGTQRGRLDLQLECKSPVQGIWGVVTTPTNNEFAVGSEGGVISIFRCPNAPSR